MPPDPPSGSRLRRSRAPPSYITLATALKDECFVLCDCPLHLSSICSRTTLLFLENNKRITIIRSWFDIVKRLTVKVNLDYFACSLPQEPFFLFTLIRQLLCLLDYQF